MISVPIACDRFEEKPFFKNTSIFEISLAVFHILIIIFLMENTYISVRFFDIHNQKIAIHRNNKVGLRMKNRGKQHFHSGFFAQPSAKNPYSQKKKYGI